MYFYLKSSPFTSLCLLHEMLNMEMGSLKDKISRLDASINSLNNKFVTLVQNAEGTEPAEMMQMISEANERIKEKVGRTSRG